MKTFVPLLLVLLVVSGTARGSVLELDGARDFIDEVAERHDLNAAELRGLFRGAHRQEAVLQAIAAPAEALPWRRYQPIFVTAERARAGVDFWHEHNALLARAEREYGVPAEIITAIIGVETYYGRYAGQYPVLDTLVTLAFEYPPRASFFRSELEQFLLLTRDEQIDPRTVKGSYAGAMGMPQFISSSYRHYAVDFDGSGQRDLWNNPADVVGSVAAYLEAHRWGRGEPIVARAEAGGDAWRDVLSNGLRPDVTGAELRAAGVRVDPMPGDDERVTLFELDGAHGPELWVGWRNFYTITRYNHSELYALAVVQLAERIVAGREGEAR